MDRRFRSSAAWFEMPDLVSVIQGEDGILDICELLLDRGVGIEAGVLSIEGTQRFIASGLLSRTRRVLIEPLDADPDNAVQHADAMERIVAGAGIALQQVHHGPHVLGGQSSRRCQRAWDQDRLEDTPALPDGRLAGGNGDLVTAAAAIIAQAERN
ncbi:hypothetical protein [Mesorhizobium sp. YR577]|uniref:hypothetical protein n=1 Tax=Mesorhizobium sp. YR577 TaxID=1884373 RepID=UPI0008E0CA72|nr:hypothetical protein [Mesorhizobium sp. YR577]SFU19519.1 hypothetical protein SAMN05518861_12144 [Mesorhizobium sp. YR577]